MHLIKRLLRVWMYLLICGVHSSVNMHTRGEAGDSFIILSVSAWFFLINMYGQIDNQPHGRFDWHSSYKYRISLLSTRGLRNANPSSQFEKATPSKLSIRIVVTQNCTSISFRLTFHRESNQILIWEFGHLLIFRFHLSFIILVVLLT